MFETASEPLVCHLLLRCARSCGKISGRKSRAAFRPGCYGGKYLSRCLADFRRCVCRSCESHSLRVSLCTKLRWSPGILKYSIAEFPLCRSPRVHPVASLFWKTMLWIARSAAPRWMDPEEPRTLLVPRSVRPSIVRVPASIRISQRGRRSRLLPQNCPSH